MKAYELTEKNQPVWEAFRDQRMGEILGKQKEKRGEINERAAKLIIGQYKEATILLNSLCPDFAQLTAEIVRKAKEIKPQKANHINGFLLAIIGDKWLTVNDKQIIVELFPIEYKTIATLLIG